MFSYVGITQKVNFYSCRDLSEDTHKLAKRSLIVNNTGGRLAGSIDQALLEQIVQVSWQINDDFKMSSFKFGKFIFQRDCLTRIKAGIAIYQSKSFFQGPLPPMIKF